MGDCAVVEGAEAVRDAPRALRVLAESEAGPQQLAVVLHLLAREGVEVALRRRRASAPAEEGAADVRAVSVGADQVGVEADDIARLDDAVRGLLEPWVGARTG